ncbi:hypothetical protein BH10PSE1_BH10PSE1_24780 [soil metagenome]
MQDFVFAPFNIFSAVALIVLAVSGGRIERVGAVLFAAVLLLTPLIDSYSVGGFRWAVALSSLSLFSVLLWMSLKGDRWWLVFAAGCQLMALSTHLIALLRIDSLQWTMVSIRWFSWLFMMGIALFGAWEGWALTRLARDRPHAS